MMQRIVGAAAQTVLGIIGGIIVLIGMAHYDPWVHNHVQRHYLAALEEGLDCHATGTVTALHVLWPTLVLRDLHICSRNKDERTLWHWHAKKYTTYFSWWRLLTKGIIGMGVSIDGLQAYTASNSDGSYAIASHINQLLAGPHLAIPLYLQSLTLHNACAVIHSHNNEWKTTCSWNSDSKKMNNQFRSVISIADGSLLHHDMTLLSQISGRVTACVVGVGSQQNVGASFECRGMWAAVPHEFCFVTGEWSNDHGSCELYNEARTLHVSPCALTYKNDDFSIDATVQAPLDVAARVLSCDAAAISSVQGMCTTSITGSLTQKILQGTAHACVSAKAMPGSEFSCATTFSLRDMLAQGHARLFMRDQIILNGDWNWNLQTVSGELSCANPESIALPMFGMQPSWMLAPSTTRCSLLIADGRVTGTCSGIASHDVLKKEVPFSGSIACSLAEGNALVNGGWKDHRYELRGNIFAPPFLTEASYVMHDQSAISITRTANNAFECVAHVSLMRSLIASLCHYDVQGEGEIRLTIGYDAEKIVCDAHLHEGIIRLPETYNFINTLKAHAEYDPKSRVCIIRNASCSLHDGAMRTMRAVIQHGPDGSIEFAHIPIWLDRCMLNSKKNFFATTSANLLLSKPLNKSYCLMGHVILDRSQLKENIFSEAFQKTLIQATQSLSRGPHIDMTCNLSLETKDPVRVDTDFVKANAQIKLAIRNTITDPLIDGSIAILSGTLKFPYKPLEINHGKIQFFEDQPMNPHVDLLAKNTVKNHRISLQVSGSLHEHIVVMDSTPPLTQEQIVGLLLAGAHDESLSAIVPALLMQNITNLVFNNNEKAGLAGVWDRYVKPWIKEFNVNFVPRLSDQTGRGGLRGVLEMSVNDRWRALIEKNFSLTEDTRFELEYLLSDDVTFRLIRDERYDIGGEVEMRWKF